MAERFEILQDGKGRRKDDTHYDIWDNLHRRGVVFELTKHQAEQVKKALDEAVKGAE